MKPTIIVDVFGDIVSKVSASLTAQLRDFDQGITGVHYLHGHPMEIIETLSQKAKSNVHKWKKYPLVALFQDFPERKFSEPGIESEPSLHLIIARATAPTYKADQRYEKNFKPVLYPIYVELLNQISISKVFMTYGTSQIPHVKIDRLYWGREGLYGNEGNAFNDWVDCIEIRDLKLKTYLNYC